MHGEGDQRIGTGVIEIPVMKVESTSRDGYSQWARHVL